MLKVTPYVCVVFTASFPMLEVFAHQHFLPTHPLCHHPLWLDENDFHGNLYFAKHKNLPHPFKIDPLAHHPQLSPYAVKKKSKRKSKSDVNSAEEKAHRAKETNKLTKTTTSSASTSSSLQKKMQTTPYKVPICTGITYPSIYFFNIEQMYINTSTSNHNLLSAIENSNYLANNIINSSTYDMISNSEKDSTDMGEHLEQMKQRNLYNPIMEEGKNLLRSMFPTPKYCENAIAISTGKLYSTQLSTQLMKEAKKYGYNSPWWGTLKQWKNLGASFLPGETGHSIPFARHTKLVHISLLSNAEEILKSSYISARRGFIRYIYKDDIIEANEDDAELLGTILQSSFLHGHEHDDIIDLESTENEMLSSHKIKVENIHDVSLRKKFFMKSILKDIERNNFKIPLYFTSTMIAEKNLRLREDAQGVELDYFTNISSYATTVDYSPMNTSNTPSPLKSELHDEIENAESSNDDNNQNNNNNNNKKSNKYYEEEELSSLESSELSSSLESGSTSLSLLSSPDVNNINDTNTRSCVSSSSSVQKPKQTTEFRHYYHLSQVRFPETFSLPAEVLAAEISNPSTPLHGLTGETLPFVELHLGHLINTAPELAAVISHKERNMSSKRHHTPISLVDQLFVNKDDEIGLQKDSNEFISSSSECETNEPANLSSEEIDQYVACNRSPRQHYGRHLWFTAKDVLQHNGLVDVNAAPIEIQIRNSHAALSLQDETTSTLEKFTGTGAKTHNETNKLCNLFTPSTSTLYNVAWLVNPEDGIKLINNITNV